jgi:hypothetical protein
MINRMIKKKDKPVGLKDVKKEYRLVFLEWVDAVTDSGWEIGSGNSKTDDVRSVGWLISKDDEVTILSGDISYDTGGIPHTNRRLSVPTKWIKSMKDIKVE